MSRISQIKKALNELEVCAYEITEITENNYEQYYVKGCLETIRKIDVVEDRVTVFKENDFNGKKTLGQADFIIEHKLTGREIKDCIKDALESAQYVHNEPYELKRGEKKQSYSYKPLDETPDVILQKIAQIFFTNSNHYLSFNSLECFFNDRTVELVNSNGVQLKKKYYEIKVEAIPSYYSEEFKTELYRMFVYDQLDYDKITEDAKQSIKDVVARGKAIKLENVNKCNIILRDEVIKDLFGEIIDSFNYASVYMKANLKKVGDNIQDSPKEPLNLFLDRKNKANFFDEEGNILNEHQLIKDGELISYYGSHRFASYLGLEAIGDLPKIVIPKGSVPIKNLQKNPYIEIIDLSGIQADYYANYVGGEVRLALYFDGKEVTPISGFSFSTTIDNALNTLQFSKEISEISNYKGPKFMKIENVDLV